MKKPNQLLQAYRQAPWRVQLQWLGFFLLGVVLIAAVAGVYLNLSARASAAGRAIQSLENQAEDLQREINDLSTRLAYLSSAEQMKARLSETEMVILDPVQAMYIEVPGYQSHNKVVLAPPPEAGSVSTPILQSEYTDSLWDWFVNNIWSANEKPSVDLGEVIP
jgi:cell division protein FtsB